MNRPAAATAGAVLLAILLGPPPTGVAQGRSVFVNTTADIFPVLPSWCLGTETCTLRAAIDKALLSRATIRACAAADCPPGVRPLATDDPGYDPTTGRWVFRFDPATFLPLIIDADGVTLDFASDVPGWDGPEDNRIVVDVGTEDAYRLLFVVTGADAVLKGFEIRGSFDNAGIILRDGAIDNQLGPGLVMAGIGQGSGILLRGAGVMGNRIVGNWCGITGDGTVVDKVFDDCVVLDGGANNNIVGGTEPADRNVFAATELGVGVRLGGDATRNNTVQGNYLGTDITGTQVLGGIESGVAIADKASDNKVLGNLLSGTRGSGVFATDASLPFGRTLTLVEGNLIGTDYTGVKSVPNKGYGVRIEGQSKDVRVYRNTMRFNRTGGALICGATTRNNTISENRITDNRGKAIDVCPRANEDVKAPAVLRVSETRVSGTACAGCRVEVFSDPAEQADAFEGAVVAGDNGEWVLEKPEGFTYRSLAATATDGQNTSALSAPKVIVPQYTPTPTRVPSPTPTAEGPTPTLGTPPPEYHEVFLPWLGRASGR